MPSRRQVLIALAIVGIALLIGAAALVMRPGVLTPIATGEALIGGPFTLTDHTGRRVTDQDFRGKFMLVFFGYTYCPDVCPTELQVMTEAVRLMGPSGDAVQPIFVTIDPERDTPETIKAYVENFGPRLIGLTGSAEDVAKAAKAYRVYYRKTETAGASDYLMDHSSIVYLMGPDGKFIEHFTYSTDAKALAEALSAAISSAR